MQEEPLSQAGSGLESDQSPLRDAGLDRAAKLRLCILKIGTGKKSSEHTASTRAYTVRLLEGLWPDSPLDSRLRNGTR